MNFLLRRIDPELWEAFGQWCDARNVSRNTALLLLVAEAVSGRITIGVRRAS
jgi:hypothetical protein